MGDYSSGDEASLPADTTNLDHVYDGTDLSNVGTNDTNYVNQTGSSGYELHQYKDSITAGNAIVTWIGKSSLAPSSSKVQLQVYKVAAPAGWQDVSGAGASNNVAAADTDFTLSGTIATADYLDSGVTTFRIYQAASGALVRTDNFNRDDGAIGSNWTTAYGSDGMVVLNLQASAGFSSDAMVYWSADSFNANQYSQVVWKGYTQTGPAVRIGTGASKDAYFIRISSTGVYNKKFLAGVETYMSVTDYSVANVSGDVFKIGIVGNQVTVYKNGTPLGDPFTENDIASGQPGMFNGNGDTSYLDDWEGGNL